MANNRMWLVHDRTRTKVLLAKWWPTVGWKAWPQEPLLIFFKGIGDADTPRLVYEESDEWPSVEGYKTIRWRPALDTPPPSAK